MQLFSRTITLYQQDLELIQQLYVNIYTEVLFPYSSLKMQTAEMLAYRGWSGRNQRRTLFLSELRQSHAHLTCSFSYVNDRTLNVLHVHLLS